ncbi:helix-turn-helix domain-containing protein [Marinobacter vinifirmus]|uniref:Helix-turn-helix domain-containing protein n=1 Tax=Marinobacter vinifirmus TaxID=355591 RepID=A0A558BD61_9GAMM|nr:helix-turn-helix domain-containing protein [Marinobacter vinifirmus]TVT34454.1 MAG: helix-turn-helix domain-containing protein [Marinobacter vinifirmus]
MRITSPEMLAQALKNIRKERQLSQSVVADNVGLKQATLSGFENKPGASRVETLFKLLTSLDLEMHLSERDAKNAEAGWDQEW